MIFDECSSGFRQSNGGLHKIYNVDPDIAMFGKALGNGYAITAVIGRREVMDVAQSTFISSTFWTERVGFAAALATIEKFTKNKVHEKLIYFGEEVNKIWNSAADNSNINIEMEKEYRYFGGMSKCVYEIRWVRTTKVWF